MLKLTSTFRDFFSSEKTGGFILILCTVVSILLTNSTWGNHYVEFWNLSLANHSLTYWINDALMSIFFLLIGLELEREIYAGELSTIKSAMLPVISAIGGVIIPALIYVVFNFNTPHLKGAGIPMATDIAFAIGVLSLLGNRIPPSLKIFLTALAVIDDLCAILVIAIFYSAGISTTYLLIALGIFIVLLLMNKLKVNVLFPYLIGGVALWYCMYLSGIHPTISGVLLAFTIPFGKGEETSISYKLQHALHYPVALVILPFFALANTCILFTSSWQSGVTNIVSIGIIIGLVIGKPLGIVLFSRLGALLGICKLPDGLTWRQILGAGILAGIGFTMSIFITLLAFDDKEMINNAKMAIVIASTIAGVIGLIYLKSQLKYPANSNLDKPL